MPLIAAGRSHIYVYRGVEDEGWRVRPGWHIDEVLKVETNARESTYDMTVLVSVPSSYTEALLWPPITTDVITDDEVVEAV